MALFGIKKDKDKKEEVVEETKVVSSTPKKTKKVVKKVVKKTIEATNPTKDLSSIIVNPRITEKGAILASEKNTYVFNVNPGATKTEIKAAIHQIYKVWPQKVSISQVPDKKVRVRGNARRMGVKSGGKKAYVYLKKGDKIDFV